MQADSKMPQNSGEVSDDRQQTCENLNEICDRTLASLKLGKQASAYKISKKAIEKFIEMMKNSQT